MVISVFFHYVSETQQTVSTVSIECQPPKGCKYFINDHPDKYNDGRTLSNTGTAFLQRGQTCFIGQIACLDRLQGERYNPLCTSCKPLLIAALSNCYTRKSGDGDASVQNLRVHRPQLNMNWELQKFRAGQGSFAKQSSQHDSPIIAS
ncbi:hypothetical protein FCULG_00000855 [Fusarium culmorum]|uniref:Uncharacterized protein n=1 Tax=Fusarium culmorum TaxID=5516 RepID=A0A2T4GJ87_FUSCU|nr:hypothetical protein FCULG_00000855 [Fusarium culmorum]